MPRVDHIIAGRGFQSKNAGPAARVGALQEPIRASLEFAYLRAGLLNVLYSSVHEYHVEIPVPPPPAYPVSISEGQTIDQVVAAMGQPLRKAKIGNKEIYTYKDMKVIFVDGQVVDIQ